jgi:hypothetical protein
MIQFEVFIRDMGDVARSFLWWVFRAKEGL